MQINKIISPFIVNIIQEDVFVLLIFVQVNLSFFITTSLITNPSLVT